MDIDVFFQAEAITEYSIVSIEDLPGPDQAGPLHLLSGARSVIVFGAEIPVPCYDLPPHEKTQNMLRIAELLDRTAAPACRSPYRRKLPFSRSPPLPPAVHQVRAGSGYRQAETRCFLWGTR